MVPYARKQSEIRGQSVANNNSKGLSREEIKRISAECLIHFCTPTYGGSVTTAYFRSFVKSTEALHQNGIRFALSTISNESLVTRARNTLVSEFLSQKQGTHLLFIDSDIGFEPQHILSMLAATLRSDAEIVVGAYRTKTIDWNHVIDQVRLGNVDPNSLETLSGRYAIRLPEQLESNDAGLIKVLDASAGFMLIQRSALNKLIEAYPQLRYDPDAKVPGAEESNHYAFFDTGITGTPPLDRYDEPSGRYLSEDYFFCRLWQQIGGTVWLDPGVELSHVGTHTFKGSIGTLLPEQ